MTKKRFIIGTLAIVTGLACLGLLAYGMYLMPGVNQTNFDRIQKGMTREEVEAILGDPAAGRGSMRKFMHPLLPELPPGGAETRWRGNDGIIIVHFDETGTVVQKGIGGSPEPLDYKIRRWLHPFENW